MKSLEKLVKSSIVALGIGVGILGFNGKTEADRCMELQSDGNPTRLLFNFNEGSGHETFSGPNSLIAIIEKYSGSLVPEDSLWTRGFHDDALEFKSFTGATIPGYNEELNRTVTVEAYINPKSQIPSDNVNRFQTIARYGNYWIFGLDETGRLWLRIWNSLGNIVDGYGNARIPAGRFTYAAFTYNGGTNTLRFFINGNLDREFLNNYAGMAGSSAPILIGKASSDSSEQGHPGQFLGIIDDLRISNIDKEIIPCEMSPLLRVPSEYISIREAVNASGNGDTILVAPGNYNEYITIKDKSVTLTGELGPDSTSISCDASPNGWTVMLPFDSTPNQEITIKGFTFISHRGISCNIQNSNINIKNNRFYNTTSIGIGNGSVNVENNYIESNSGVIIDDGSLNLRNNIINAQTPLTIKTIDSVFVSNNDFIATDNTLCFINGGSSNLTFSNNIFYRNFSLGYQPCFFPESSNNQGCNDIYSLNNGLPSNIQPSDILQNPLFCNPNNNFYLDISSPCTPEHSNGCGLIGALNAGCNLVSVLNTSLEDKLLISPNPFSNKLHVIYNVTEKSPTTISIYDIQGRIIKSFNKQLQEPGVYSIDFDSYNIPVGIYFIKFNNSNKIKNQKVVKVR